MLLPRIDVDLRSGCCCSFGRLLLGVSPFAWSRYQSKFTLGWSAARRAGAKWRTVQSVLKRDKLQHHRHVRIGPDSHSRLRVQNAR